MVDTPGYGGYQADVLLVFLAGRTLEAVEHYWKDKWAAVLAVAKATALMWEEFSKVKTHDWL